MVLPPAADARVHGKQMEGLILALCTLSTWPAVKVQWKCLQHRNLEKAALPWGAIRSLCELNINIRFLLGGF